MTKVIFEMIDAGQLAIARFPAHWRCCGFTSSFRSLLDHDFALKLLRR